MNTKSAGYPPEVIKKMLQVTYNEEASGYDEERYKERAHDARLMRQIKDLLPKHLKGGRVLELASGTGYWGKYIESLGHEYIGIELSKGMVTESRNKGLFVVHGDVEDLDTYPIWTNSVVCIKAFGFFPDSTKVLENVRKCLVEGGRFINFYYNCRYRNLLVRLYSLFKDPDIISYQPPWDERFTWSQYRRMSQEAGMKVVYMRDCVSLPYKLIPEKWWPIVDKLDDRLTHFGFVTMAVSEKI